MSFINKYPYTDFHELNLDYLLNRLKNVEESIANIKESIEAEVFEYVQQTLAPYEARLNALIIEVNNLSGRVDDTLSQYDQRITQFINEVNDALSLMRKDLENSIIAVNNLTDTKIENNNIYLLNEVSKNVGALFRVINPFTGQSVSIQEMIDYLSAFHISDGIDYSTMNTRALTYTQFNNLGITYTELLLHGNTLYV